MEKVRTDRENVIQFSIESSAVTVMFGVDEAEGAKVKERILDILTEAYRERLQRDPPFAKAG